MIQLRIYQLTPYLPFDLKVNVGSNAEKRKLIGVDVESEYAFISKGREYRHIDISEIYPILRPLHDILNEINGRCFIDQFEIGEEGNGTEYDFGNTKLIKALEDIASSELGHLEVQYLPYSVTIQLLRCHYDIFGLINKGLAVDINSLK